MSTKISFPAMKGVMGKRDYYSCMVNLSEVPRLFTFNESPDLPIEARAQRPLNKGRINPIKNYIVDNEDGWLFSSLSASYKGDAVFTPCDVSPNMGTLAMDLGDTQFILNDGQHRAAGIKPALIALPDLGGAEQINVLFFPFESLERMQQMFADLNRAVVRTPMPLNIVFDGRDIRSRIVLALINKVPAFVGLVDKERSTLPTKSTCLFTLLALYEATNEYFDALYAGVDQATILFDDKLATAVEFWTAVSSRIKEWEAVRTGRMSSMELRQKTISTHSVTLRAIGATGGQLRLTDEKHWKQRLTALSSVDFNKANPEWLNTVVVSGSVISSRQARIAAKVIMRKKLKLETPAEEIALLAPKQEPAKTTASATGTPKKRRTPRKMAA